MQIAKENVNAIQKSVAKQAADGATTVFYPTDTLVTPRDLYYAKEGQDIRLPRRNPVADKGNYAEADAKEVLAALKVISEKKVPVADYEFTHRSSNIEAIDVGKMLKELPTPSSHIYFVAPLQHTDISNLPKNDQAMNEKNLEYLQKQVKLTGYGEEHHKELREELKKQNPAFTLYHQQDYGKDTVVASLHFKKSDSSDMYFLNRHTVILKNEKYPDTIRQSFYIDHGKDNVTLKEGYNLLSGRAVEKNLETKQGEKYVAWVQLNFKETNKHGDYETRQFHQKYGFDLEKSLLNLPLKIANPDEKKRLMESLQRGNRQVVTIETGGQERKILIEAAPQFKSLNYYNESGKRLQLQSALQSPEQAFGEKQGKTESKTQKAGKGDEDSEGSRPKKKQVKRQGVSH